MLPDWEGSEAGTGCDQAKPIIQRSSSVVCVFLSPLCPEKAVDIVEYEHLKNVFYIFFRQETNPRGHIGVGENRIFNISLHSDV